MVNSRRKGKEGELEFARECREAGYEVRRSQQYCGAAGDADVVGLPGLHVEVKRVNKLNIDKAMEQARGDASDGQMPVVAHRKDGGRWMVTMDLATFWRLYREWEAGEYMRARGWIE